MLFDTEKQTLKLFIERAEGVLRSRFVQTVLSQQTGCKMVWKIGDGMTIDYPDCPEDDRDAFVLSLRLFIQNSDRISIYNMTQIVEAIPVSDAVKVPFREQRAELNRYLESHPFFTAAGELKSFRELLNILVYGDISHFDPKLRPVLERWMADPLVWPHMQTQFFMVCQVIVVCLSVFRTLSQMALDELARSTPHTEAAPHSSSC